MRSITGTVSEQQPLTLAESSKASDSDEPAASRSIDRRRESYTRPATPLLREEAEAEAAGSVPEGDEAVACGLRIDRRSSLRPPPGPTESCPASPWLSELLVLRRRGEVPEGTLAVLLNDNGEERRPRRPAAGRRATTSGGRKKRWAAVSGRGPVGIRGGRSGHAGQKE
jgi:hypothetical protein